MGEEAKDILLVEDEIELADLMKTFFAREGWSICHAKSGEEALQMLENQPLKIAILDIMLPAMDGFAVCRAIREKKNIPVLIVSARVSKQDKLSGYELGADDYIEKPVDIDILMAKIKALLERSYGKKEQPELLVSGEITIDKTARQVYLRGRPVELNVKEYELLLLMAENPGRTLHKEYMFNQVWGADSFSESQTLTVHIKMLRSKTEENPREPRRIKTVWGVGYRYEEV